MTDKKKLVEALAELYLHLNQTYGDDNEWGYVLVFALQKPHYFYKTLLGKN